MGTLTANEVKESKVVAIVGSIYRDSNNGKGHSWQILNGALHRALVLCIEAHLPFEEDDFANMMNRFNGGYWFGTDGDGKGSGTNFYSTAVKAGNATACKSFEKWRGFEPYLFLGERMAVGSEFRILPEPDEVTRIVSEMRRGFTDPNLRDAIFNACPCWFVTNFDSEELRLSSYYRPDNKGGHQQGKPTKRKVITHEELDTWNKTWRTAMRERKAATRAAEKTDADA